MQSAATYYDIGTGNDTTINAYGFQYVGDSKGGGSASGTTINAGGQFVGDYNGRGTAIGTTIDGTQFVADREGSGGRHHDQQ